MRARGYDCGVIGRPTVVVTGIVWKATDFDFLIPLVYWVELPRGIRVDRGYFCLVVGIWRGRLISRCV